MAWENHNPRSGARDFPIGTLKGLEFNFEAIQLNQLNFNQLNWRDYLNQPNPLAAALMSKMQIARDDRPKVKAECLRLLAILRLDPARTRLISGFIDTYRRLSQPEEQVFQDELGKIESTEREGIMEIVTSWMEQGLEQGLQREKELILRQLARQVGVLPDSASSQIETLSIAQLEMLGEALLDFSSLADLKSWLAEQIG